MATENQREQGFLERAGNAVRDYLTPRPNFMGGEFYAAIRQGFNEIGAALKAFPDSLQVEEPGAAFNPLYRDMPGNPKNQGTGPVQAEPASPALPSPSEIANGQDAANIHGDTRQASPQQPSPSEIVGQQQAPEPQQGQGQDRGSIHGDARQDGKPALPSPSEIMNEQQSSSPQQEHGQDHDHEHGRTR